MLRQFRIRFTDLRHAKTPAIDRLHQSTLANHSNERAVRVVHVFSYEPGSTEIVVSHLCRLKSQGAKRCADALFTATAVVLQPVTGYLLARQLGWDLTEGWILVSLFLYLVTGLFWLPVVWIQIRLRDLARAAAELGHPLPAAFDRLYRIWFACGFPAFFAVLGIFWLMLAKPDIALF